MRSRSLEPRFALLLLCSHPPPVLQAHSLQLPAPSSAHPASLAAPLTCIIKVGWRSITNFTGPGPKLSFHYTTHQLSLSIQFGNLHSSVSSFKVLKLQRRDVSVQFNADRTDRAQHRQD